jgi:hypothetical protein
MNLNHRIAPVLAVVALLVATVPACAQHEHTASAQASTTKVAETGAALRDLWVGHVFWVRNVVVATLDGNQAAATAAEKEVVANAKQIAGSIEPFYGKEASDKLFGLLAGHYGAVKQYLEATTAGSTAKQEAALKTLTDNAGEIATFLSGANPNLPRDAVLSLLAAHGGHHVQQIQQLKAKQYDQEAQTWTAMKGHMYVIADTLAGALAKQFPAKFAATTSG